MTDNVSIKDILGLIERLEDSLRRTITDLTALRNTEVLPLPQVPLLPLVQRSVTVKPVFPDMPVGKKRGPKPYSEMTAEEVAAARARKAANKAANSVKEPKMTIIRPEMIGAPEPVTEPTPASVAVKPKRVIKLKK